jgi:hypothetical protein
MYVVFPELVTTLLFPLLRRTDITLLLALYIRLPCAVLLQYYLHRLLVAMQQSLLAAFTSEDFRASVKIRHRMFLSRCPGGGTYRSMPFLMPSLRMSPYLHLSWLRSQRSFIFAHALLVLSPAKPSPLPCPRLASQLVLLSLLPSRIYAFDTPISTMDIVLQMIRPPPASYRSRAVLPSCQHTRASRLRDGRPRPRPSAPFPTNAAPPLVNCFPSPTSADEPPDRSSRAHSHKPLLEHLFVFSPALCGAGRGKPCLKRSSTYPGSMVLRQRYLSSRMGTSHRHADVL